MNEKNGTYTYPIVEEKINDYKYDEVPGEYNIEASNSEDAAALLVQVIKKGYDPNRLAQEFLKAPAASWNSKGVSNLGTSYTEDEVRIFTNQILEMLERAER